MSNSLAIAAVTATLRNLLNQVASPLPFDPDPDGDLTDTTCTTRALDKARQSEEKNQINLFLYQTAINAGLRNTDLPHRTRPGETGAPALALNLYYLVTAFGRGFDELLAQRVMGRAMSILHDRAVLLPADIELALPESDLANQVERVRVVPHTLGGEELSKLWSVFQAPYRLTTAYQVSVVMIDSARRTHTPLPVLTRNVTVRPNILPPFPTVERVKLPRSQPAARIGSVAPAIAGDAVILEGHDLDGDQATVSFSHPLLATPNQIVVATPAAAQLAVTLPPAQADWPAGAWTVSARVVRTTPSKDQTSNAATLAIAPRFIGGVPGSYARDGSGDVAVNVTVSPQVWPAQRVSLLIGTREVPAPPRNAKTATLSFVVPDLPLGEHVVRLRVDGIDSLVIDYTAEPPTAFDATQKITVA